MSDTEHVGLIDGVALRRYADRIISLRAERSTINTDMGAVFKEAKEAGFVPEMLRGVVREMEMDSDARATFFQTQDAYRRALGMLADMPLGEAAIEREAATVARPRPFAEQPLHRTRPTRGRPRKPDVVDEMVGTANRTRRRPRKADRVEEALDLEPAGTA